MKWLEIIELRFGGNNRERLESQLQTLIDEAKQQAIKVYSHVTVETDFSIHLRHDSKRADVSGSPLGLRLASVLKEYGLVNHSVWIEMHKKL
ncbi:MAG: hypothetical protein KAW56_03280 [Candidatus Marinimicrobia bacterium]|nr:hypothetical protein [Candidatus Neomarinimicrobiota bacterium]